MKVQRRFISEGHLIDSGILADILNLIVDEGADYKIIDFTIGKTNQNTSRLEIELICDSEEQLAGVTKKLVQHGCYEKAVTQALLKPAPKNGAVPEDFYSTTNHRTEVYSGEKWLPVENMRMDAVITVTTGKKKDAHHNSISGAENKDIGPESPEGAVCKKIRDVKEGELVVCSAESVRVFPPERERDSDTFGFMTGNVSSERSVDITVGKIAAELSQQRETGKKIVFVAGPVVVHTGGAMALGRLIKGGYVQVLLSGNALAVHDLESQFFGTSLGVDLRTGKPTNEGHKNHMRAINRVRIRGSIKACIDAGELKAGVMYETITNNIPYSLAGSIRDDGPLPETEMDLAAAQEQYAQLIRGSSMVVMLSSMLHSIGTGNMLPSWVKTVCVDINPAVVTKLSDRGSGQAVGIVSDVGLFLRALSDKLCE